MRISLRQVLKLALAGALVASPAVDTLVVAAVGDRDPQVGDRASEFVGERHDCWSLWEKRRRREHPGRRFLSNALLAERGRRERFCSHPRNRSSLRSPRDFLCVLCVKSFYRREHGELPRSSQSNLVPRRRSLGMPEGRGGRKLAHHYRACRGKKGFKVWKCPGRSESRPPPEEP